MTHDVDVKVELSLGELREAFEHLALGADRADQVFDHLKAKAQPAQPAGQPAQPAQPGAKPAQPAGRS
jgi:hypothetical protein